MTDLTTTSTATRPNSPQHPAWSGALDDTQVGDIRSALETLTAGDTAPRRRRSASFKTKLKTHLTIVCPSLIVIHVVQLTRGH
ncbi:hypothetical protein [Streptomyces sp. CT34]|uniref:hypothetical protein n=1 Tax=Streptomyces sp. CT34 TaxID=1553907 RepID=UPI0005BABE07|nr:hypothetical protein [Streptomyces sp. CT34]